MQRCRYGMIAAAALTGAISACVSTPAPVEVREAYVEVEDGVQLYLRVRGEAQDTIMVLHGGAMGLPLEYLAPDLESLTDGYTLVFYDQRGGGGSTLVSDSAHLRISDHIDDLERVRQHLGIERMKILGHSWGGGLGARYALEYPDAVERLILVGPMPIRFSPHWEEFGQNLVAWMDGPTLEEYRVVSQRMALLADAPDPHAVCRDFWDVYMRGYLAAPRRAAVQRMRGDLCAASAESLRNAEVLREATMRALGDFDWREDFQQVQVPVLVVHGSEDPIPMESSREWAAAFPNARLVVVDGAGHYPHVEQPERFFDTVLEFLAADSSTR